MSNKIPYVLGDRTGYPGPDCAGQHKPPPSEMCSGPLCKAWMEANATDAPCSLDHLHDPHYWMSAANPVWSRCPGVEDHRRWVCREIAADARRDVHDFEGRPFTGRTVAEYMGLQAALIAALAKVVESLLPAESSAEPWWQPEPLSRDADQDGQDPAQQPSGHEVDPAARDAERCGAKADHGGDQEQ